MTSRLHSGLYGLVPHRERVVAGARGVVLELGGGLNVAHYRDVERVVICEPDAANHGALLDRVAAAAVPVEVHESAMTDTGLVAASFDTVVLTFVLCTTKEPYDLLAALKSLLRADGQLIFLEHVRGGGVVGTMQNVASYMWQRTFDGCHPDRDAVAAIREAGFFITDLDRFSIRRSPVPVRPAVRGVARKAAA
ncbi:MAG TPA: methyltransferase domain-containing protein [Acidimicrobiales bacterium]|nr:methyltransferase domain-containing protein [Acidimicrobiales bacterium]